MLTLLISLASLAACGGDPPHEAGASTLPPASPVQLTASNSSRLPPAHPVVLPTAAPGRKDQVAQRDISVPGSVTHVVLQNTGSVAQSGAPLTFGQVFAPGHVGAGDSVAGQLDDGASVPLQVDVKARHPDGSVRHAIVSLLAPTLAPAQRRTVGLMKISASRAAELATAAGPAIEPAALLEKGFSAQVKLSLGGRLYSASADALLRSGKYTSWLSGTTVSEWHVSAPLMAGELAHPHLSARFAIRAARGANRARVDVTIENAWAYEPAPQNFTYDAEILIDGKSVYAKPALTHYHHARWRKLFWWGGAEPQVHVRHHTGYLIASRAVPNYDQSLVIGEVELNAMKSAYTGTRTEPMGTGLAIPAMPNTGGRPDIGILPGWGATYLLSMDPRAREASFGTADLAGSWSTHYRNKLSDRPVTLEEFPYMTILGNPGDTLNPRTGKREAFPACATSTACQTPNRHDSSHQPGFAYLPYLLSGDFYYLEELQFWAMWNAFASNPGYRQNIKGLLAPDQVRGQAWSLRTLAQAAYITPDADPLKAQLAALVNHNLDWYNTTYSFNPAANRLGVLTNGAVVYHNGTGIAPWQDDFFTAAVGHAHELGFAKAKPLLSWKAKFPVQRMIGAGSCWIDGAMYSLVIRPSATAPFFTDIGSAALATHTTTFSSLPCASEAMASFLKLRVGEMTGYSSTPIGYPSNMQPALAYAALTGEGGVQAWALFANRSVKPNYARGPQFAIIPRRLAP